MCTIFEHIGLQNETTERIKKSFGNCFTFIIYIMFAFIIVYLEEIAIGHRLYRLHQRFLVVVVLETTFENLGENRQVFFYEYYNLDF